MKTKNSGAKTRALALIRKESMQMLRDKSTLTLGVILPIFLLLLFGFGLSLDVTLVPVAVVREHQSPQVRDFYTSLKLSPYFAPIMTSSMPEAEEQLRQGRVQAIVRVGPRPEDSGADIQIIVNGRDSNQARIMQRYLEGAAARWQGLKSRAYREDAPGRGQAEAEARVWYNDALESRYFLVPGVTVLIMTLIGALLTALVIAREWERGTYEALAATPAGVLEIVAGKTVPYFALGMVGLCLCLAAASFVFGVPMRGPMALVVAGSALYLLVALGMGLLISALTKSQFLASQVVLVLSFLPTLMLSGFIFDLRSAPVFVRYLAHVFPATWYVDLMQTLFLVGTPDTVLRDLAVLAAFAVLLLALARLKIKKSLE